MNIPGYTISSLLGDGGMASVYKGEQLSLQRPVAIKVLKHKLIDHEEIRKRFERESIIIARLSHPNIIHVIDQGVLEDGRPFFVMEYVKSIGLHIAIKNSAMTQNRALDIFTQIAKALAYAHKNNIIHCDIKPENILVDFEGTIRVLDFGIAQIFEDMGQGSQDGQGFVLGSDNYMAPEQHSSITAATERSDIYSLGVIMYLYFTRQLPRDFSSDFHCPRVAELNKTVPAALDDLIMQCLEIDALKRPKNADAVKNRLLRILQGGHLNDTQHQRASAGLQKSIRLLDVIKENRHGAVYLFEEQGRAAEFIVKKKAATSPGYEVAQILARVKHPNLVQLYGSSKNQRTFIIVMEYCGGGSLAERLLHPFDTANFYICASQILAGLQVAHAAGVIHGNLRPTNILFNDKNIVKLSDFGLDEHYQSSDQATPQKNWYTVDNEQPSVAADIFALGVIFYHMLSAELPQWKDGKIIKQKRFHQLPLDLQDLIRSMLIRDSKQRVITLPKIAAGLDELFSENTTRVHGGDSDSDKVIDAEEKGKNKSWMVVAALAVLCVFGLVGYFLL